MTQKASRWKKVIKVISTGVLLVGLAITGTGCTQKSSDTAMKIGDYTITEEHLELYENDFRAKVTSYFYKKYQADPNEEGFWEKDFDGEIPAEILKKEATERLVYDTVERIEASKHGIQTDITLKDIKKSLEKMNEERKNSTNIAYGPSQYGLAEYISRTQMDVSNALKTELLDGELKPSKEQLMEVYENADQSLFDKGCNAKVGIYMYYGMKAGEYPEELKSIWTFVKEEAEAGKDPTDIVNEVNGKFRTQIEYDEAEYDTDNLPRDNAQISWLIEQTSKMQSGEISEVLDYGSAQGILEVLEKTDYGKFEFEESEVLLTNIWLNESYTEYMEKCMETYGYSFR